jgi:tetratricopeptide (TPR) repeat protein
LAITLVWAMAILPAIAGIARADGDDASAEFDRLYGQALTEVGVSPSRDDDVELAAEMLRTASQRTDAPALAEMLCWSAYELTDDVEDAFATAAGAMELIARRSPTGRARALDRLAGLYRRRLSHRDRLERAIAAEVLVQVQLDLTRCHLLAGDPSRAAGSIQRALSQARSVRSPALEQAVALNAVVARRVSLAKRLEVLDQALRANPADLAARTSAIRLCLAEFDDPNRARAYVDA